jgi:hypothetical protein
VEQAKRSVLFETPIAHFLVRAFLAEGVDEFLAHITTIEAALGLRSDYQKSFRIAPDRHKGMRATDRIRFYWRRGRQSADRGCHRGGRDNHAIDAERVAAARRLIGVNLKRPAAQTVAINQEG